MIAFAKSEPMESFDERINRLFRELEQAVKWNRPSILLAVYSSEFVRADAEAALGAKLHELGHTVTPYRVTAEENADIPLNLFQHPEKAKTVFFISGLQWGGGKDGRNAYRALNIRREYFVDYLIRAVFWLTEKEAIALPTHAPDFWAFRHRVVEFVETPEPGRIVPLAKKLAWQDFEDRTLHKDTDAKIALRESLLNDLPKNNETLHARVDLLYTLSGLYGAKNEHEKSIELLHQALRLAERSQNVHLQARCHNGFGIVYSDIGRYDEAIAAYHRAVELESQWAAPYIGLGSVYRNLGRYDEANSVYQRAIELDPQWAAPYAGLGFVYCDAGYYDEAIAVYQRAIEFQPQLALPYVGLGRVYRDLGRYDEANIAYQHAIELDPQWAAPHAGLGSVYRDLDRYDEAIAAYQRAIELDPRNAYSYIGLGDIYAKMSRTNDAISKYRLAIALEPQNARYRTSIAGFYRKLGKESEYIEQIKIARELIGQEDEYNRASFESVCGNVEQALELLKAAIEKKQITKVWARRDPDFDFIRDDPRFKALVGE